jgi:phage terminase small subunit
MNKKVRPLTPKQKQFTLEYMIDRNATQAAIRAGYSKKTSESIGLQLLRKTTVRQAIDEAIKAQEKRTGISADRVLAELAKVAFLDVSGAFWEDGALKPIHEIPKNVVAAIAGIEIDELYEGTGKAREHVGQTKRLKLNDKIRAREHVGQTKRLKLNDKIRALELLGKNLKLFTDKHELSGSLNVVLNGEETEL